MICLDKVKQFCKDDYTKIKNYDLAISDNKIVWHCHHILELTLNNEFAHSKDELIRMDMYYKRPYFELIFLKPNDHKKLHLDNLSEHTRKKLSRLCTKTWTGRKHTKDTKEKMSLSHLNHNGWNAKKRAFTNGIKNILAYTCPSGFRPGWTWNPESRNRIESSHAKEKLK